MTMDEPDIYELAFSSISGLSVDDSRQLIDRVGGEREFFVLNRDSLVEATGIDNKIFAREFRDSLLERAYRELAFMEGKRIRFLYHTDPDYPDRLKEIDNAPLRLFVAGNVNLNGSKIIAIVGTRHSTAYGLSAISNIVSDLASSIGDVIVVSGVAYGSDIAAHRAAMKSGLPTVGVFAHGLSTIYPAVHREDVAEMIRRGGGVVTEYGFDAAVHKMNFLARNRIVAGMSDCLLLAESRIKGGAIVTSHLATDYGRRLFAIPGRVSDIYSEGCNALISSGEAQLVMSADDIIESMGWGEKREGRQREMFIQLSADEQKVVDLLRAEGGLSVAAISSRLSMKPGELMGLLVSLEFKGMVANLPGAKVMLT